MYIKRLKTIINVGFILSLVLLFVLFLFKSEQSNTLLFGYSRNRILIILSTIILESIVIYFTYSVNKNWAKVCNILNKYFYKSNSYSILLSFPTTFLIFFYIIILRIINNQIIPSYLIIQLFPSLGIISLLFLELIIVILFWGFEEMGGGKKLLNEMISPNSFCNYLKVILIFYSFYFVIEVFITIILRFRYPFELEWMEGQSLIQVKRILLGNPLYVKPTVNYIPMIYPPFYFYFSAALSFITGEGFVPLRLVSIVSTIIISYLIFLITLKYSKNKAISLISVGFFCCTFIAGGAWFDIARVDMLSILFFLLGFYYGQSSRPSKNILSGLCYCLSIMTKQSIVFSVMLFFCYYFFENKKKFLRIICTFSLFFILIVGFEMITSEGWFAYYIFNQAASHQLNIIGKIIPTIIELIKQIPLLSILSILFLLINIFLKKELDKYSQVFLLYISLTFYSLISRINPGGYNNVFIPYFICNSITASIFLDLAIKYVSRNKISYLFTPLILVFFIFYFNNQDFLIVNQIPSNQDLQTGETLLDNVSHFKGEVFFSSASYLNLYIGKETNVHWISMMELLGNFGGEPSKDGLLLLNELKGMIKDRKFDLLVLDRNGEYYHIDVDKYYSLNYTLNCNCFYPITGSTTRPTYFYIPKVSNVF